MPHEGVRSGAHQLVVFIKAGLNAELPAQVRHRGPGHDGRNRSRNHGYDRPRRADWRVERNVQNEGHHQRRRFQQHPDARRRGHGDGGALLKMRRAEQKRIPPHHPAQQDLDRSHGAHTSRVRHQPRRLGIGFHQPRRARRVILAQRPVFGIAQVSRPDHVGGIDVRGVLDPFVEHVLWAVAHEYQFPARRSGQFLADADAALPDRRS